MKWITAQQAADKYNVKVTRVRADLRRHKFGDGQKKVGEYKRAIWLIDDLKARERYGSQQQEKG